MTITNVVFVILAFIGGINAFPILRPPSPVVIIPGDGGSQAYASQKNSTPFLVWVNFEYMIFPSFLEKYFMLNYDPNSHTTIDPADTQIFFPGFGETWSIENLDENVHQQTLYFRDLINSLSDESVGLKKNVTLRAAPFDFRKAPNEMEEYFNNLRMLIEETSQNGGKERVILLAHSMGNLVAQYFLKNIVDANWKQKYLRAFIAMSAPFGGAVKAMKLMASGDNLSVYFERDRNYRSLQRSFPSTAFLMPHPQLWPPDEPIAFTPNRNYSAHEYEDFFTDIKFETGSSMRQDTEPLVDPFYIPNDIDELYCLYGVDLPTPETLHWIKPTIIHAGFPDESPNIGNGNGDGTVNIRSLELCKSWPNVNHKTFPKVEHMSTVSSPDVIDTVRNIVLQGDRGYLHPRKHN